MAFLIEKFGVLEDKMLVLRILFLKKIKMPKNKFENQKISNRLVKSVENIEKEFAEGFQFVSNIKRGVAIFGSGRAPKDSAHYQKAKELSEMLSKEGLAIITGGGPGIMEAGNWGAYEGGGESVGFNILIPDGQLYNKYVKKGMQFNYFFSRKAMFAAASSAYVFFPGGFGTLDEFFEMVNLVHNRKINNPPLLIAVGKDYWQPLFDWLKETVYRKYRAIDSKDFDLVHVVNSPKEAFEIISKKLL